MSQNASNPSLKASLEELARFGCPVDLSVAVTEVENDKVEIEQVGGEIESQVFELQDGRIAYMIRIAVTNWTPRTIDVVKVELLPRWDDSFFQWLHPYKIKLVPRAENRQLVYQFPGSPMLWWPDDVINHQLLEQRRLPGKRRLDGYLFAIGGPMPAELRHGQRIDMPLVITAAAYGEYPTTIQVWTNRISAIERIVKPRISLSPRGRTEEAMRPVDVTRITPSVGQVPASNRT
jgi:hypothetical protein